MMTKKTALLQIAQQKNEPDFSQKALSGSFFCCERKRAGSSYSGNGIYKSGQPAVSHIFLPQNLYETRRIVAFLRQF